MESDLRSEISLLGHEDVLEDIVKIRKELQNQVVSFIRNIAGSVQGLGDYHIYVKIKSALMQLHCDLRPKQSSLPIFFLDIFMPDSVDWLAHLRLRKLMQVEEYVNKMESVLYNNGIHFESSNDIVECVGN